jgi:hypothetical protein
MKISTAQILLCCECLLYALATPSNGHTFPEKEESKDGFAIKVGVEEVRIDAVVLDRKGRQITDLNSEDFEIFQDGVRQNIQSIKYINEYHPQPEIKSGSSRNPKAIPPLPSPMPERDEVRRTFVFLVDNVVGAVSDPPIRKKLVLENSIEPGNYVLLLSVKNKNGFARQAFDFTVQAPQ